MQYAYDLTQEQLDELEIPALNKCLQFIEHKFNFDVSDKALQSFTFGGKWQCDYDVGTWSVLQWIHFERLVNKFPDNKQIERTLSILPIYFYLSEKSADYTASRFQNQDLVHRLPTRYVLPAIQELQASLKRVRSEFPEIYTQPSEAQKETDGHYGIDKQIHSEYGPMYELMSFVASYDSETIQAIQKKNVRDFLDRAQYVLLANKREVKRQKQRQKK